MGSGGPQGELCSTGGPQGELHSTLGSGGPHTESPSAMSCLLMAEPRQTELAVPAKPLCAQPCSVGTSSVSWGTGKAELPECRNGPAAAAVDPREAGLAGVGTGIYIANPHEAELEHPGPAKSLLWSWQTQLFLLRVICLVIT